MKNEHLKGATQADRREKQAFVVLRHLALVVALLTLARGGTARAAGVVATPTEAALTSAMSGGGLVTFTCDGTITLTAPLSISGTTTIDGAGHNIVLSGNHRQRIFTLGSGANVTLRHLTLTGGRADGAAAGPPEAPDDAGHDGSGHAGQGGAIYNDGLLTLEACQFTDNLAIGQTGAYFYGINTWIPAGTAGGNGEGGAIYNAGTLDIERCTFSGNRAEGGSGGNGGLDSTPTSADGGGGTGGAGRGGAIANYGGTLTITNSDFAGNKAKGGIGGYGGDSKFDRFDGLDGQPGYDGFLNWGQWVAVDGGDGTDGGPAYMQSSNAGPGGSGGDAYGGAIDTGNLNLTGCTLRGNTAEGGAGGDGGDGADGAFGGAGGRGGYGSFGANGNNTHYDGDYPTPGGPGGNGGAGSDGANGTDASSGGNGGNGGSAYGGGMWCNGTVVCINCTLALNHAHGGSGGTGGAAGNGGHGGNGGDGGGGGAGGNGGAGYEYFERGGDGGNGNTGGDGGSGGNGGSAGSSGSGGYGQGGAVFLSSVQAAFTNCTITANTVAGGQGGPSVPAGFGGEAGQGGAAGLGGPGGGWFENFGNPGWDGTAGWPGTGGYGGGGGYAGTTSQGAGSAIAGASATFTNSIITGRNASNCTQALSNGGHNLDSDGSCGLGPATDPKVGAIADNGGPTFTAALIPGSPAINNGDNSKATATDQRGASRYGNSDIGAYEFWGTLSGANGVTVSGAVLRGDGSGLAGITVTLSPAPAGTSSTLTTDATGIYSFLHVPPGSYTLTATGNGHTFAPSLRRFTVTGADIGGQDFRIAYTVSGRIVTLAGVAIPNVNLTCARTTPGDSPAPILTNSAGYFTFTGVGDGTYTLTPSAAGYAFSPAKRSVTVTVTNGNLAGYNFSGGTPFTIGGRVVAGSEGLGAVTITATSENGAIALSTSSYGDGYFQFPGVPGGTYLLRANDTHNRYTFPATPRTATPTSPTANFAPIVRVTGTVYGFIGMTGPVKMTLLPTAGGAAKTTSTTSSSAFTFTDILTGDYILTPSLAGAIFVPPNQTVHVSTSDRSGFIFHAAPVYSISGRVIDGLSAALQAPVTLSNGSSSRTVTPNSAGYYSFIVSPGSFTLAAALPDYRFTPATRSVTIDVASVAGMNFQGLKVFAASGRVATGDGTGVSGVAIVRSGAPAGTAPVLTDTNGNYSMPDIPGGTYTLTPMRSGSSFSPVSATVSPTSRVANFRAYFNLSGRIVTSSGAGIGGVSVALSPTPPGVTSPVQTNSSGNYLFTGLPPGLYTLAASRTGYLFSPATQGLRISTAPRAANFVGTVVSRVYGRITSSSGVALGGVTVTLANRGSVSTNSAGYYMFTGVPNGTYTLTPAQTGKTFSPASRSVTTSGDDISGMNFIGG